MIADYKKAIFIIAEITAIIGLIGLLFLALMITTDGLCRAIIGHPLDGVRDVSSLTIACAVAACMPLTIIERGHISVHLFEKYHHGLAGKVLKSLVSIFVLVISVFLACGLTKFAFDAWSQNEVTPVLEFPVYPFWIVVAIFFWFAVLAQSVIVLEDTVGQNNFVESAN